MTATDNYLAASRRLIDRVGDQAETISSVADRFAESILVGGLVHLFGSGHSRMMVEEMWPRYGSFPGFHPIVELSLTHHHSVVGANGQRQAMFLENVGGLAERILRNFKLRISDCALVVSSSGCNRVPIEMADGFRQAGLLTVGLVSVAHQAASTSRDPAGRKLGDCVDLLLDSGAPAGDSAVTIEGLDQPVSPLSTIGGCLVINALKAEIAQRLTSAGSPPKVLTASCIAGHDGARQLFEDAYDEHARRVARLHLDAGFDETRQPSKES